MIDATFLCAVCAKTECGIQSLKKKMNKNKQSTRTHCLSPITPHGKLKFVRFMEFEMPFYENENENE